MSPEMTRIYENCRDNMEDTLEDWKIVFDFLFKIWTREKNDDIQECILALEDYLRKDKNSKGQKV